MKLSKEVLFPNDHLTIKRLVDLIDKESFNKFCIYHNLPFAVKFEEP